MPPVRVTAGLTDLDLRRAGITTVVSATGYRREYPWLQVPVLDPAGEIRQHWGVTPSAGLYVVGLRFQTRRNSTFIDGARHDAQLVVDHLDRASPTGGGADPAEGRMISDTSLRTDASRRWDAVVVGARCAGAATAMLLARHGMDVLVLDRARNGSDTVSTHGWFAAARCSFAAGACSTGSWPRGRPASAGRSSTTARVPGSKTSWCRSSRSRAWTGSTRRGAPS